MFKAFQFFSVKKNILNITYRSWSKHFKFFLMFFSVKFHYKITIKSY